MVLFIILCVIGWLLIGFSAALFSICADLRGTEYSALKVRLSIDGEIILILSILGIISWIYIFSMLLFSSEFGYKAIYKLANIGYKKDKIKENKDEELE